MILPRSKKKKKTEKDTKIAIICHCAVQHNSDEIFLVAQIILGKAGFMQ